ncbi:MAG: type II CRISPR-associated endonuclease Cas1 [Deferribacteraceae bacterium]|jgi:CRISPR-associated protein Cas1|nr:type II CRISPR-associated endonuclease Cas1 [Deferribacteraceae bacterium]
MIRRIVDIAIENVYLSKERGFLLVKQGENEAKIPLDDIESVIIHSYSATYSHMLLMELAERGIPMVVCGKNHSPSAILLALNGNYLQAGRIDSQIAASKPMNKRLWQDVVSAKILNQATVLAHYNLPNKVLIELAKGVTSGDSSNNEAQAARYYWQMLMSDGFLRNQDGEDFCNIALNYGYAILRSSMARAIVGVGLQPSLGIHHYNKQNPMRLVDDMMEPFRPVVDMIVCDLAAGGATELGKDEKLALAKCIHFDIAGADGRTPVVNWMEKVAINLLYVYEGVKKKLEMPIM